MIAGSGCAQTAGKERSAFRRMNTDESPDLAESSHAMAAVCQLCDSARTQCIGHETACDVAVACSLVAGPQIAVSGYLPIREHFHAAR
jgi:hypothetical protein